MSQDSYQLVAQVSSEKFDDEVMIVNLTNGNYYSLAGTGAAIWTLIEGGNSHANMLAFLSANYQGNPEAIDESLKRFISELVSESLISAVDGADTDSDPLDPTDATALGDRPEFSAPRLDKYTDMQQLLLIDPIHEVSDEQGWPKVKP